MVSGLFRSLKSNIVQKILELPVLNAEYAMKLKSSVGAVAMRSPMRTILGRPFWEVVSNGIGIGLA